MPEYNLGTAQGQIRITTDVADIEQLRAALGELSNQGDRTGSRLQGGMQKASAALSVVGKTALAAGGSVVVGLGYAVKTAADFEAGLSGIQAVSGATAGEMDKIRAAALRIGKDTSFSASEAADAISELAKAGVSTEDILNGAADATVALAAAGGVALPEAATIASNAMNQFGLSAKELPKVADLIAGAANASAIDVSQFGQSLSQVGAVAKLAGLSFDDTTVAIAELGNAGIVGSDAGTSLKTFLSSLQPINDKTGATFKELGLLTKEGTSAFYDQTGKLKPLVEIQALLQKGLKGLSEAQQQSALKTIFGSDAIRAAAVLAGNGAKGYEKLSDAINKTKAADVAKVRLDNLNGSFEQLKGSVETVAINVGSVLLPVLKQIVDSVNEVVGVFSSIPAPVQAIIVVVGLVAAAIATFLGGLALVAAAFLPLITAAGAAVAALGGLAVVGPIAAALAGVVAIIAGVVAALVAFFTQTQLGRDIVATFVSTMIANFQKFQSFMSDLGASLAPIVTGITDFATNFAAAFQTGFANVQAAVQQFLNFFNSAVLPVIQPVFDTIGQIVSSFASGFGAGFQSVIDAVTLVVNFLATNVGPVIATAFQFISDAVSNFTTFFISAWQQIQPAIQPVIDFFVNVIGPNLVQIFQVIGIAVGALVGVILLLSAPFVAVGIAIAAFIAILVGIITVISNVANALSTAAGVIRDTFGAVFGTIAGIVSTAFNAVVSTITSVIGTISGVISSGLSTIGGIFSSVFNAIAPIVSSAFNSIRSIIGSVISIIQSLIQAGLYYIRQIFATVFGALAGIVGPPLAAVRSAVTSGLNAARAAVQTALNAVRSVFTTVFGALVGIVSGPINTVRSTITSGVNTARSAVTSAFNTIRSTVQSVMSAIASAVSSGIAKVIGFFTGLGSRIIGALQGIVGQAFSAGAAIVGGLVNGLLSGLGKIASAAASIAAKVKAALPHSPAKEGPFSGSGWTDVERSGLAIANQFAGGLVKGAGIVGAAAQAMLAPVPIKITAAGTAAAGTAQRVFGDLAKSIAGSFRDGITGTSQQVQDSISKLADDINSRLTTVVDDRKKALANVTSLNKQLAAVKKPTRGKKESAKDYAKDVAEYNKKRADIKKQIADQKSDIAALTKLADPKTQTTLSAILNRDNGILQKLADQRDIIADQLKTAQTALDSAVKTRDDYASSVTQSIVNMGNVAKAYNDAVSQATDAASKAETLQGKIDDLDSSIGTSTSDRKSLLSKITAKLAVSKNDKYTAATRAAALNQANALTTQLAALDKKVANYTSDRASLGAQLAAAQKTAAASPVDLLLQNLQDDVTKTAKFQDLIGKLKAAGLDGTSYKQLVDDFTQNGDTSLAESLAAAGTDTIKRVSDLQNQLQKAASSLGTVTSSSLYQSGVDAAQGIVDGLTSQKAQIEAAMSSIADSLVARIKAELKIKSPSRVARDEIGAMFVKGIGVGVLGGIGEIQKNASAVVTGLMKTTTRLMGSTPLIP